MSLWIKRPCIRKYMYTYRMFNIQQLFALIHKFQSKIALRSSSIHIPTVKFLCKISGNIHFPAEGKSGTEKNDQLGNLHFFYLSPASWMNLRKLYPDWGLLRQLGPLPVNAYAFLSARSKVHTWISVWDRVMVGPDSQECHIASWFPALNAIVCYSSIHQLPLESDSKSAWFSCWRNSSYKILRYYRRRKLEWCLAVLRITLWYRKVACDVSQKI